MKRNRPPDESDCCPTDEQAIIDNRLEELFSSPSESQRRILLSSKGFWLDDMRHVKIENIKGIAKEFIKYSRELKYHYLDPYGSLYCLEANQLLIYYNGFPLSLAEAYELLLDGRKDFLNYRVFQFLSRSGYVCFEQKLSDDTQLFQTETNEDSSDLLSEPQQSSTQAPQVDPKQLPNVSDYDCSIKRNLERLRKNGPQEISVSSLISVTNFTRLDIAFSVYKREYFASNKPSKLKEGKPDFHLVVCDKSAQTIPNCRQLLEYDLQEKQPTRTGLLFALVDDDLSICFAQFKATNSSDLILF